VEDVMTFEIAIIKWIDSTYYRIEGCVNKEEINEVKPKEIYSVGILVYQDEDCIIISQDFEPTTNSERLVLTIPKRSVINYVIKKIKFDTKK
jgi:hypothetical protein